MWMYKHMYLDKTYQKKVLKSFKKGVDTYDCM
nr:MAG TPA: hypothetical protein [Bacteriophage sp.]